MYGDEDIAKQLEDNNFMVENHKSLKNPDPKKGKMVSSVDIKMSDEAFNSLGEESTKKEPPRHYKNGRGFFSKNQAKGFTIGLAMLLAITGVKVGQSLAKAELRDTVDPILTEYASGVTHDYEEAFKKNDINVFFGFTPDGDRNVERDSSRNYRFMNEYFDGEANMDFFEYLTGRFGVNEVLKCGIQVSHTLKGVADQNDKTVEEFLGGLSPEEWAKNMYNEFIAKNVTSVEGKGL